MDSIAEFVKKRRKLLKLTQKELAAKAGVGYRFIRELEGGKTTIQVVKANEVLKLFGFELGPVPMKRSKLIDEKS